MAKEKKNLNYKTPKGTASFVSVYSTRKNNRGEDKYGLMMVFTPKQQGKAFKKMVKELDKFMESIYGPKKSWPKKLHYPIRSGDEKNRELKADGKKPEAIYKGAMFFNANANADRRPGVVEFIDGEVEDCTDLYSGCIVRSTVQFFTFDTDGNRGVGVGLQNVLKVKDGERLDGRTAAEDDFSEDDV